MPRIYLLPTLVVLAGIAAFGQIMIGPGIGYPGGGYPGGRQRYPGNQQPYPQTNQNNTNSLTGILRKIDDKDVVIETDDQTIDTVQTPGSTKYTGATGGKAKITDFQPGDHIRISATQNNSNGNYKAESMTLVTEGTTEEHAAASQAMDDPIRPITKGSSDSGSSRASNSSGDRPQLRRASNSDSTSSSSPGDDDPDRPKLRRAGSSDSSSSSASNNSSSSSSNSDDDPDRPRLKRAASSSDNTTSSSSSSSASSTPPSAPIDPNSSSTVAPRRPSSSGSYGNSPSASSTPSTRDSDDPGPPVLRRSSPSSSSSPSTDSPTQIADSRPSLHADDTGGVTRLPPPPSESTVGRRRDSTGDDVIDQAREAAFAFSDTLPNYVVKQFTTRYETAPSRGGKANWDVLDNVTADVIEVDGKEQYKNILVNGKTPRTNVEDSGSWSSGEFSSLLLDVLSPATNAEFHGKRPTRIANRDAFKYDYSVEQPNSHWHVEARNQNYSPAYTGTIWIDKQTFRVLRVELAANNIPHSFPLDTVESAVDYDFVLIGDGKFLLPTHSEALSCARGTNDCSRNVIEFRNYRKFSAESSITFDP